MAGSVDFTIDQGASFHESVAWENPDNSPVNTTGWRAVLTARARHRKSATSLFTLTSNPAAGLTVGNAGTIDIQIDGDTSAAWTWRFAFYDLLVWNPSAPGTSESRLFQGVFTLDPQMSVRA